MGGDLGEAGAGGNREVVRVHEDRRVRRELVADADQVEIGALDHAEDVTEALDVDALRRVVADRACVVEPEAELLADHVVAAAGEEQGVYGPLAGSCNWAIRRLRLVTPRSVVVASL